MSTLWAIVSGTLSILAVSAAPITSDDISTIAGSPSGNSTLPSQPLTVGADWFRLRIRESYAQLRHAGFTEEYTLRLATVFSELDDPSSTTHYQPKDFPLFAAQYLYHTGSFAITSIFNTRAPQARAGTSAPVPSPSGTCTSHSRRRR